MTEWLNKKILNKFNNESWNESIIKLHDPKNIGNFKTDFYRRLAFDEILASFLVVTVAFAPDPSPLIGTCV